jgi:hypothetical protein
MNSRIDATSSLANPAGDTAGVMPVEVVVTSHSTGPRTAEGKAIASRNRTGHGIYAMSPVVDGLESAEDWSVYRQAMLASLAPVGMVEETLAERGILTAWRMRRISGYETRKLLRPIREQTDKHAADDRQRHRQQQFVQWVATAGDAEPIAESAAQWLLERACKARPAIDDGVPDDDSNGDTLDGLLEELSGPSTVGEVREVIGHLAARRHTTVAELLSEVQQGIAQESDAAQRQLAVLHQECLMPDDQTLGQVMRYESHLARLFHRDLHELQRLQASRNGQLVAAPMVMDIDAAGVAGVPDGSSSSRGD